MHTLATKSLRARRRTKAPEAAKAFSVSDDGIGIPPDKLEEVLEPFGQVDDTNARQHGGTGLGLPITKSLIEMHGGSFRIESTLGEGTTAIMTLPGWRLTWKDGNEKTAAG